MKINVYNFFLTVYTSLMNINRTLEDDHVSGFHDDASHPDCRTCATEKQVTAALEIARAVSDTIRELGTVPEGVLYANLMGHMSLASFTSLIEMLKRTKLITVNAHLITWVGK